MVQGNPSGISRAEIFLMGMVLVWALNFSIIKFSLAEIDPFSFNAMRFISAIALLWLAVWIRKIPIRIEKSDLGRILLLSLIGTLVYQMLFIIGADRTFASNAAVMLGLIPVWIAVFSHFFTQEKMYRIQAIGVVIAFCGVALIMGGSQDGLSLNRETFTGDLIIVSAAMLFAGYSILSLPLLKKYSSLMLSTLVMSIGGVMLILIGLPFLIQLDHASISIWSYGGALYSGIFAIGFALIVWNFGIKSVGAVRTSTYQNLVPVFGVLFGLIFLGEKLYFLQYLGCLLTIGGIILCRSKRGGRL